MSKIALLVLLMLALYLSPAECKTVYIPTEAEEIIHFCQNNGKDFLTITTRDFDDRKVRLKIDTFLLHLQFFKKNITNSA